MDFIKIFETQRGLSVIPSPPPLRLRPCHCRKTCQTHYKMLHCRLDSEERERVDKAGESRVQRSNWKCANLRKYWESWENTHTCKHTRTYMHTHTHSLTYTYTHTHTLYTPLLPLELNLFARIHKDAHKLQRSLPPPYPPYPPSTTPLLESFAGMQIYNTAGKLGPTCDILRY